MSNKPLYLKVRAYILNIVRKAPPNELTRIPSENELCALLGVSRKTVCSALNGLIGQELLAQRGIGMFVNSAYCNQPRSTFYAIGTINGRGSNATEGLFAGVVTRAIHACGMCQETLYMPDSGLVARMIKVAKHLDAVIWTGVQPVLEEYLHALRAAHVPLLLLNPATGIAHDFDRIYRNSHDTGDAAAEIAMGNGHQRVFFISTNATAKKARLIPGDVYYQLYARLHRLEHPQQVSDEDLCYLDELPARLRRPEFRKHYTLIYCPAEVVPELIHQLDAVGMSIPQDISLIVYGNSSRHLFGGLQPTTIDTEQFIADAIEAWLCNRILHKNSSANFEKTIVHRIIPGATVKKINPELTSSPSDENSPQKKC